MNKWQTIPSNAVLLETVENLTKNGMTAEVVENGSAAKARVLALIPKGAEVMTMTSVTADTIDLTKSLATSGDFNLIRDKLSSMDRETQHIEMQRLGSAHDYVIGSVHAITQDGHVFIASSTGSQLPAYAYGSTNVIWVVGAQKIVKDFDEALKRIYDHALPLESERAQKAYGVAGSSVNKILVINKESKTDRIHIILVKEVLGF